MTLNDASNDAKNASRWVEFFWFCSLAGISRSVTIAAAYIISVTGLSVAEALQAVRSSRTIANPNFGFQKQLYDYFEVNAGGLKVSFQGHFKKCSSKLHFLNKKSISGFNASTKKSSMLA